MTTQTTRRTLPAARAAAGRLSKPRRARGRIVDLRDHAWFDLFRDGARPTGETTVEIVTAAIRAAN